MATIVNNTVTVNEMQSAADTVVQSGRLHVVGQLQTVMVTGQVNNFANAVIELLAGVGELTQQSANEYLLDLGTTWPSGDSLTTELGITNWASAPGDDLAATFVLQESAFAFNGFESFDGLAAGATRSGLTVQLDSVDLGSVASEVRLIPRSENVSGFSDALGEITINLVAQLALPGDANVDGHVDVTDFNIWNDNRGNLNATWGTGDFNGDGLTDELDFTIWSDHKFTALPPESIVPEPNSVVAFVFATAMLTLYFRKSPSR